jgi:hypothetical protein
VKRPPSTEELGVSEDEIREMLDNPAYADSFELARRFGSAVRAHFRGRRLNSEMIIGAAMAAISGALRDARPEEWEDRVQQIQNSIYMLNMLVGVLHQPRQDN